MDTIINNIYQQAQAIGQCGLFKGTESLQDLVALFRSPQGQEFCLKHGFPSIEAMRKLNRKHDLSRFGIYVDAGRVNLSNEPQITLVGNTSGELRYDELKRHEVILMHGARATIVAEKWAVVFVNNDRLGSYTKKQKGNSKIL